MQIVNFMCSCEFSQPKQNQKHCFGVKEIDFGVTEIGIQPPVLPFNSYVALRKLFHLSDPQILQL